MKTTILIFGLIAALYSHSSGQMVTTTTPDPKAVHLAPDDTTGTILPEYWVTKPDSTGTVKYYQLYRGSKGGVFYWRVSGRTGNPYKVYLTPEQYNTRKP